MALSALLTSASAVSPSFGKSEMPILGLTLQLFAWSPVPISQGSLKVRPEGTILDGHHRIKILRDRGVDVDSLPRELIPQDLVPEP